MSIHAIAAPVSTLVEAGVRAVSAVTSLPGVPPVDDQGGHAQPSPDEPSAKAAIDREALETATQALNQFFSLRRAELHFSIDDATDRLVVKVIDARDGSLIRQIPNEQALRMAQALQSEIPVLFEHKA